MGARTTGLTVVLSQVDSYSHLDNEVTQIDEQPRVIVITPLPLPSRHRNQTTAAPATSRHQIHSPTASGNELDRDARLSGESHSGTPSHRPTHSVNVQDQIDQGQEDPVDSRELREGRVDLEVGHAEPPTRGIVDELPSEPGSVAPSNGGEELRSQDPNRALRLPLTRHRTPVENVPSRAPDYCSSAVRSQAPPSPSPKRVAARSWAGFDWPP
jgi:hypothetical protein